MIVGHETLQPDRYICIVMASILVLFVLLVITVPTALTGCLYSIFACDYGEMV